MREWWSDVFSETSCMVGREEDMGTLRLRFTKGSTQHRLGDRQFLLYPQIARQVQALGIQGNCT